VCVNAVNDSNPLLYSPIKDYPSLQFREVSMKIIRMMMLGLLMCAVALASGLNSGAMFATCTGSDPCNARKNCKYCQHCAKDGGTCGVCKNYLRTQRASLR